jgi:hypothetical protein
MIDDDARIWRGLRAHLDDLGRLSPSPDLAAVRERADRRDPLRRMSLISATGIAVAVVLTVVVVGELGRLAPAAVPRAITSQPPQGPTASAEVSDLTPVSLSAPSAMAADGIRLCGVQQRATQIAAIGIIDHARLLPYYVPLTGREPEIQTDSPAFVVQFSGTIRMNPRGQPGHPAYVDAQGVTCIVLNGVPITYVLGPSTDSLGHSYTPEPAPMDTRALPAPLP